MLSKATITTPSAVIVAPIGILSRMIRQCRHSRQGAREFDCRDVFGQEFSPAHILDLQSINPHTSLENKLQVWCEQDTTIKPDEYAGMDWTAFAALIRQQAAREGVQ